MAAQKRQCINCRYFQDAGMAGSGWCTHPKRQEASAVRLLVRRGELACRNSWGGDLFSSKDGDDESRVEPTVDPVAAAGAYRPAPIDDEVTSVTTPPIRRSPDEETTIAHPDDGSDEDRVVSDRPAPRRDNQRDEPDNRNDAARSDQDERARLIARGNSDALAHARERLFDRKRRLSVGEGAKDHDTLDAGDVDVEPIHTATSALHDHDRRSSRQPRYFQRFGKTDTRKPEALPGDSPVPRAEVRRRQGDTLSPDRYESIPEVDPSFDLPGWRKSRTLNQNDTAPAGPPEPEPLEPMDVAPASIDTSDDSADPSDTAFEHTVNRARRIRESKRPPRPHTVRVDHFGPGQRATTQSRSPSASEGEPTSVGHSAATYLPDNDEDDGSVRKYRLDTTSDVHEPVHDPSHRVQRRGWFEQFGIRRSAGRDEPRTVEIDAPAADRAHDRHYPSVIDTDDGTTQDDDHHYADGYDQPIVAQQRGALESIADDNFGNEDSEVTYIPNTPSNRDFGANERASRKSRYILPDLDAVFAERTPANLYEPEVREYEQSSPRLSETASHRVAPDLVSGGDEQLDSRPEFADRSSSRVDDHADTDAHHDTLGSGSRWSRESTSSPRESWFRARRFSEWERTHGAESSEPRPSTYSNGHFADGEPVAGHDQTNDRQSLPDLDAHGFDLRDIVERGGELLDMTIAIAPDIPRACRTCRSFQSADGGVRGWCTSEWAFTHRRMVNEDDLACDATIGCWWLPDDRYWKSDPPVSWELATPLIDEYIARRTRSPRRKTSGA